MRTVNVVNRGQVTVSGAVADDGHTEYHKGQKYVPVLINGQWQGVREDKLRTVKPTHKDALASARSH